MPGLVHLPPRPSTAVGQFLRVLMVNDLYKLDNYPRVATAFAEQRAGSASLGCSVITTVNGDLLSPCTLTALDGGRSMMTALNKLCIDYVCIGASSRPV